jgi:hypothetical protein
MRDEGEKGGAQAPRAEGQTQNKKRQGADWNGEADVTARCLVERRGRRGCRNVQEFTRTHGRTGMHKNVQKHAGKGQGKGGDHRGGRRKRARLNGIGDRRLRNKTLTIQSDKKGSMHGFCDNVRKKR